MKKSRKWLNPRNSDDTGAMSWSVEGDSYNVNANLTIRDCSRQVSLDLSCSSKTSKWDTSYAERADKLELMIAELTKFKYALHSEYLSHLNKKAAHEAKMEKRGPRKPTMYRTLEELEDME